MHDMSGRSASLCELCGWMRAVVTPKGSRFLLCALAREDPRYPKYPPQPLFRCAGLRSVETPPGPQPAEGDHDP